MTTATRFPWRMIRGIMTTVSSGPGPWVVTGLFALLALLVVPVFPHFVSPNEMSRWARAAVSLVDRGTLSFAPDVAALLGPRFEDVAERDGRLYPNKAPGSGARGASRLPRRPAVRGSAGSGLDAARRHGDALERVDDPGPPPRPPLRRRGPSPRGRARPAAPSGAPLRDARSSRTGSSSSRHALVALGLFGGWAPPLPSGSLREPAAATSPPERSSASPSCRTTRPSSPPRSSPLAAAWGRSPARSSGSLSGRFHSPSSSSATTSRPSEAPSPCPWRYETVRGLPEPARARRSTGSAGLRCGTSSASSSTLRRGSSSSRRSSWRRSPRPRRRPRQLGPAGRRHASRRAPLAPPRLFRLPRLARRLHGRRALPRSGPPVPPPPRSRSSSGARSRRPSPAPRRPRSRSRRSSFRSSRPASRCPWGSFAAPLLVAGPRRAEPPPPRRAAAGESRAVRPRPGGGPRRDRAGAARPVPGGEPSSGLPRASLLPLLSPLSPPLVVQRGYVEEVYFTRAGALERSMPRGGAGAAAAPGAEGAGRDAAALSLAVLTRQIRKRGTTRPSGAR